MSSDTRKVVEAEVTALVNNAYERAKSILTAHEKELHALADVRSRRVLIHGICPTLSGFLLHFPWPRRRVPQEMSGILGLL